MLDYLNTIYPVRYTVLAWAASACCWPFSRWWPLVRAPSAFTTPLELLQFVAWLRDVAEGKPTGITLCIGHPWEWFALVKAMLASGIAPDFIVLDGAEGGTGAASCLH